MTDLFTQLDALKTFPPDQPDNVRRFYSPQDKVHEAITAMIESATQSLVISMFGEDDPELTALVIKAAQNPAIYVQVNLDKTQAAGAGEVPLVAQLRACPATRVAVGTSESGEINHLKMAVCDGYYTLTGSTNWSTAKGSRGGGEGEGDGKHGQNNEMSIFRDRVIAHEATTILNLEHQEMLAQEARRKTTLAGSG